MLKPASARPNAARRPAPPAPTTMASYSWSYPISSAMPISFVAQYTYNDRVFVANKRRRFFRSEWRVCDNSSCNEVRLMIKLIIKCAEDPERIPAGLVDEKDLVWLLNACVNCKGSLLVIRSPITSEVEGLKSTHGRTSCKSTHCD